MERLLSEYMVAKHRQGFDYNSVYIATYLFEKLIKDKLKHACLDKYNAMINRDNKNSLEDFIEEIEKQTKIYSKLESPTNKKIDVCDLFRHSNIFHIRDTPAAISQLKTFKKLRNDIIHTSDIDKLLNNTVWMCEFIFFMRYLVSEYSSDFFNSHLRVMDTYDNGGLAKAIDSTYADYLVRSVDEKMIKRIDKKKGAIKKDWVITESDFGNLLSMRDLLVRLKNTIDDWLVENDYGMTTTILTTIDTSSAYIWMPIVQNTDCLIEEDDRPNLRKPSASILVTPLDFRIYIDFGGQCKEERSSYFDFLIVENGHFSKYINNELSYNDRENFFVFDIEWYSFIVSQKNINKVINGWADFVDEVKSYKDELNHTCKNSIITRSRALSGYIYDRQWIKENGPLTEDFIKNKLKKIIELYRSLIIWKKN